jgi:3-phenylpropionate/trans-cinnamate dioxygenase ferredoxin subunit
MAFEICATVGELAPGHMKRVNVAGRALLLVNADGEYYAVDEICSHEDYSLYYGCIRDRTIMCSLHGSCFDLATGRPLDEPATESIGTCAVKVDGNNILVAAG